MAKILFIVPLLAVLVLMASGESDFSELEERLLQELRGRVNDKRPFEEEHGVHEPNEKIRLEEKQYDDILQPIEDSVWDDKQPHPFSDGLWGLRNPGASSAESDHVNVCENLPVGGDGGNCFSDEAAYKASGKDHITGFQVRAGSTVDCLGFIYGNKDGYCHGGEEGTLYQQTLGATERITGFSGSAGSMIDQITIHTNVRTYGPYGGMGGSPYTLTSKDKEVAYISGTAGAKLDSFLVRYRC